MANLSPRYAEKLWTALCKTWKGKFPNLADSVFFWKLLTTSASRESEGKKAPENLLFADISYLVQ
jgi:hypothetical protein